MVREKTFKRTLTFAFFPFHGLVRLLLSQLGVTFQCP